MAALFKSSQEHGSIWLTHKRDDASAIKREDGEEDISEYPCLVRVTDGKEAGFSTRVGVSLLLNHLLYLTPHRSNLGSWTPFTPHTAPSSKVP